MYFFILCQIQGNLKEYCCHKIDKRYKDFNSRKNLLTVYNSIDEMLQKQRKKRIRQQEKERNYAGSISSKKSKKSNTNQKENVEPMPALPTLPVFNDASLYAGEKKQPWLYQHAEQQDSFYYESQQMTPLESSYSLQRNPTNKYSPYNETPMIPYQQQAYQPRDNYTNNYYNGSNSPQYSNTIANPTNAISGYSNAGYQQNSSSNLHEYDSYQRNDTYTVAQSSPSVQNAAVNTQYTGSPQVQKSTPYTNYQQSYEDLHNQPKASTVDDYYSSGSPQPQKSTNYHKSHTVDDYYYDEHNSYPLQQTKAPSNTYTNYI